ncbi:MAG: FHA domain-containing protein [Methylotenera sp.]|nr:MAG: FHA domain-containing protein [Methylotenera sp.]
MAKLILSLDHALLNEYPLDQERITIGRRPTNDVQIDNLAVSGEHAAIVKLGNDFYIEDLASTNGTIVNSTPVKKHLLQHDDVVEFGKYQLKYINQSAVNNAMDTDFEKTMIIRPSAMRSMESTPSESSLSKPSATSIPAVTPISVPEPKSVSTSSIPPLNDKPKMASTAASNSAAERLGKIQVLNGSSTGRQLVLNKALTTLGKPGVQVAVITKRPNGYFITHVEGQVFPIVNGASTGAQAFALNDHDVIELAGVKMEFYLS